MIILTLIVLGLILGSFVEALVWRLHEQSVISKTNAKTRKTQADPELSILKGRSLCPYCRHQLAPNDLIPILSWLELRGKCRYCSHPIGIQAPLIELGLALLFVVSYLYWPDGFDTQGTVNLVVWLASLVGLTALAVYDARWLVLPNKLVYPLILIGGSLSIYNAFSVNDITVYGRDLLLAILIGAGLFYALFQLSKGKWIGGGDVKLGVLIGFLLANPISSFLVLFIASLLGTLFVVPGILARRVQTNSHIPFGPFLIVALIIVKLFGQSLVNWYKDILLLS